MVDLEALREELRRGLAGLEEDQKEFVRKMSDKIDKAEQSLVLESLAKVNLRLAAIEEKLAERDTDKEDANVVDTKPKLKDRF